MPVAVWSDGAGPDKDRVLSDGKNNIATFERYAFIKISPEDSKLIAGVNFPSPEDTELLFGLRVGLTHLTWTLSLPGRQLRGSERFSVTDSRGHQVGEQRQQRWDFLEPGSIQTGCSTRGALKLEV